MENTKNTYIYKYVTKNNELLGYHYDSFCTVGQNKLQAKRYTTDDPDSQKDVIQSNFKYMCKTYGNGNFVKETPMTDVVICYEVLAPDVIENNPMHFAFKQIQ